jgi:hypothetical protein
MNANIQHRSFGCFKIHLIMKKILLFITALIISANCMAQAQLAFPFQGGKAIMTRFFKDSLVVSPQIIQKKASGLVLFKFTADTKGGISKIIIYYADDAVLVPPIIEALKKSNHKWIIPDKEKFNDFILPFSYSFNPPPPGIKGVQKAVYDFNQSKKPIFSTDQVPLDLATLLPTIMVTYDISQ